MLRGLASIGLVATLLTGCDVIGLVAIGNLPHSQTIVDNDSGTGYVAQIDDYHAATTGRAYIAVPAYSVTVVDSEGEMNSMTSHVWLWTSDCVAPSQVLGNYEEGGAITISETGDVSFAANHSGNSSPTELDVAVESCEEAAALLP